MMTANLAMMSPEVEAAAGRFRGFFQELARTFVEREDLLAQIALALLAREHVLMTGPPGTAKSGVAAAVLGRIVDERTGKPSVFARQFTESTVQTDLVGPIDFKTLMQSGRTEHFTDEGMLGAVHAFLDEVLDGRDMLLRTTLNVLQERELKQGTKTTAGQIECALMTTNRYLAEVLEGSRETLLAFVDRIAFVSFIPKGFSDAESLGRVVRSQIGGARRPLTSLLTIQDLDVLQAIADRVVVGDELCGALCTLLEHLDADLAQAAKHDPTFLATRYLSTRTAVRLGRILRAICVYDAIMNGATRTLEAEHQDLALLRLSVLLSGPSHGSLARLIERESDPRERRQLSILRTEREIFDRALARLPKPAAKKKEPRKENKLEAKVEEAIAAPAPAPLLETAAELAKVSDAGGPGAQQAQALLDTTLGHLAERALRAGATAGAGPSNDAGAVVTELSTLADGLEQASGATRPVARWLRGRAIRILLDSASLMGHSLDRLEVILGTCERLRAAGADLDADLAERATSLAVTRVEDDLVESCDAGFRDAVADSLKRVGDEDLGVLLKALAPALAQIDTIGARLVALGGKPDSLKTKVIGARIEPLVKAAFARVNTTDRAALVEQVGQLVDALHASNLRAVLPKTTVLRFAVEALVRSEQGKGTVPPSPVRDYDGYRALRSSMQRVSLAFTTTELALRTSPEKPALAHTPDALVSSMSDVIAALPETLRQEVVTLDLARIDRAVAFVETWWSQLSARSDLAALEASKFFVVTREEGALLRFTLEARVIADVFPEAAERVGPMRARIEALEAASSKALVDLRRVRADAAWGEILGPRS
ncbi:MAG: AAA family ATPase [Labilithrix sp.]|nr:AAA family ATPase [Labilithrix sp.]MCW5815837.1 AAA family ATPase [Labilithrix sp.]